MREKKKKNMELARFFIRGKLTWQTLEEEGAADEASQGDNLVDKILARHMKAVT